MLQHLSPLCNEIECGFVTVAMREKDLPLVKVQQLSRFLAFGLGLHYIPVFHIHTPPCGWILTGKQSTHGSRELTPSPANTGKHGQFVNPLFYMNGVQHYAIKHVLLSH